MIKIKCEPPDKCLEQPAVSKTNVCKVSFLNTSVK